MEKKSWTVVERSAQYAVFNCGGERKRIDTPSNPHDRLIFMSLQPGMILEQRSLQLFLRPRLLAKHSDE